MNNTQLAKSLEKLSSGFRIDPLDGALKEDAAKATINGRRFGAVFLCPFSWHNAEKCAMMGTENKGGCMHDT